MKFFETSDFEFFYEDRLEPVMARDLANAKLKRDGVVIYGNLRGDGTLSCGKPFANTHKALLINIEPIEESVNYQELYEDLKTKWEEYNKTLDACTHPAKNISIVHNLKTSVSYYECSCGVEVKPKTFEVK